MTKKKIVVAGAGYAGVLIAKKLAKQIKKQKLAKETEITLIDKNPFHTMLTELHEVAAWRVEEDSIKISLERVFAGRDVRVVMDTICSVERDNKQVLGNNGTYEYDYLVLATGSKPMFFGVEGAQEHAFTLWSYEDAVRLREHVMEVFRRAACETNEEQKRALLTFVVVGCGFTGVEMAGELAELVPHLCRRFEIDPALVTMINTDILDKVCPILPDKLGKKVQRRLEKTGVNVLLNAQTTSIGADYFEYQAGGKTQRVYSRTIIWTAGIEAADVSKAASEALGASQRGRIQTDGFLRAANDTSVYVGGDNMFYIPEGETEPVPQMVENCEACAKVIAHNLMCDITGKGERKKYAPKFHGVMVCVGGRYGVAHVGMPGKFFALPSFFAMLSKHFINIIYFLEVLGWNKVFSYLRHEFFTIRDCRSFVGGHFSNRSPSFMLVPLRLWLGFFWLFEGIKKVGEGWLETPMLTNFFMWANQFYEDIFAANAAGLVYDAATAATDAASGATDAVSSATGAATGVAGNLIFSFDLFNQFRFILVQAGDYAFKLQVGFVDFIINWFVLPYPEAQMAFQISIVVLEILLGLALLGGLFTTPAAAMTLILQGMFVTSTGLYMDTWWVVFAGIAMLFGGGRAFSMDYYVMPWLKTRWKKLKFVRRWYIYHD